jgi:hypothetical protein
MFRCEINYAIRKVFAVIHPAEMVDFMQNLLSVTING